MILKQNSFIISDNELNALETGTYRSNDRMITTPNGIEIVDSPVSYTGSSIQRRNYKATKQIKKEQANTEHELSNRSKTKIAQKILAWSHATKQISGRPRYTFLTLTLTSQQNGKDAQFTKMQNVFFTYCRKYFGLKNYLYMLEKQTKTTGNVHSHVLIDKPLPIVRLNYIWCKILGDHGYTFQSTDSCTGITQTLNCNEAMKVYRASPIIPGQKMGQKKRYVSSPNPADIKFIYNLKAVSHYITKYITKNETKINTSIWNCSQSISRLWVGARISTLKYYSQLSEVIHKTIRIKLDEGHVLNVCLLKYYTKIQDEIFSNINQQYLIET